MLFTHKRGVSKVVGCDKRFILMAQCVAKIFTWWIATRGGEVLYIQKITTQL